MKNQNQTTIIIILKSVHFEATKMEKHVNELEEENEKKNDCNMKYQKKRKRPQFLVHKLWRISNEKVLKKMIKPN